VSSDRVGPIDPLLEIEHPTKKDRAPAGKDQRAVIVALSRTGKTVLPPNILQSITRSRYDKRLTAIVIPIWNRSPAANPFVAEVLPS
jgi:hypothetical protein